MLIPDGGTLVIGGLIQDKATNTEQRVPFLSRIPLIGELFRARDTEKTKTNLMVFLQPHILHDDHAGGAGNRLQVRVHAQRAAQAQQAKPRSLPLAPLHEARCDAAAHSPEPGCATRAHRRRQPALRSRPEPHRPVPQPQRPGRSPRRPAPATAPPGAATASPGVALNDPRGGCGAAELRLPFAFARRHGLLVRSSPDGSAECLYRPPAAPAAIAEVRRLLRVPLSYTAIGPEEFDALLQKTYEAGNESMQAVEGLEGGTDLAHLVQELPEQADLLESNDDAPIIRLINAVLTQAVRENASDIHIEPFENRLVVRFRVDGVLREVLQSKRAVAPMVVSRIKVMSRLDIAEKRLPQDGRISLKRRRPLGGRARLDHSLRARRARGAASARQAGRAARARIARHGRADPGS